MKIGVLGGTFNPVHLGHLLIAQDAAEQAGLDRVKFIPAATPPHKIPDRLAAGRHRLAMLRLAIRGLRQCEVDNLELRRGGRSYSVDTLTTLKRRQPNAEFFFIIGADSLPELHRWRAIRRLARLCRFVVVARPGYRLRPPRVPVDWMVVTGHPCAISSTEIRQRVASGRAIRYLVPEPVRRYICQHNLYR
jgi:nicotinate-nucleotide adenylyltransferase